MSVLTPLTQTTLTATSLQRHGASYNMNSSWQPTYTCVKIYNMYAGTHRVAAWVPPCGEHPVFIVFISQCYFDLL